MCYVRYSPIDMNANSMMKADNDECRNNECYRVINAASGRRRPRAM